ncbi:hypothetical protein ACTL6P_19695 [Endozoicomonas acroporae]|uniref:hypothetical protein n=1 Tax=Endozoicomonas acroporae TaxID=1701104 RepID=UPI000C77A00F|nr:hypothetical protein [Endozoicomonas acroporae]
MPRFECEVLITGYDVKRRAAVIERWHDLESGKATPMVQLKEPPLPVDPHLQLEKNIASTRSAIALAEALGFTGNQKLLSADRMLKSQIGFSPLEAMGQKALSASVQEMTFTPTQLGAMLDSVISGRKINQRLMQAGFQVRHDKTWNPTEQGKPFCEVLDVGKHHGDGTPVKQVKWYKTVLDELTTPFDEVQEATASEPKPQRKSRTIKSGRKHKPYTKGLYGLDGYFSTREIGVMADLNFMQVSQILLREGYLTKRKNRYTLSEKGFAEGHAMYDTQYKKVYKESFENLPHTCGAVFNESILDLF